MHWYCTAGATARVYTLYRWGYSLGLHIVMLGLQPGFTHCTAGATARVYTLYRWGYSPGLHIVLIEPYLYYSYPYLLSS